MTDVQEAELPSPAPVLHERYRDVLGRLSSAQKRATGAPGYSRYVNRRIGRHLAAGAYLLGRTPNQVTALSAVCSAAGIALLASVRPGPTIGLLVTGLLLLGYALDSADGQLARLRGMSSRSGEWLDHMVDCAKITSLHLAVLVSVYRFDQLNSKALLLVPLGFCVVAVALFFGVTLSDLLRRVHAASADGRNRQSARGGRLQSVALFPVDFGIVASSLLLLGWPRAFLFTYLLLFAAHVVILALACVKWFRDLGEENP